MSELKAPFPAFGGKSQVVDLVWRRLGETRNYCEPFAFSAVMLLRRPTIGAIETINDLNAFVSNFWRAIKADPDAVAAHADSPVNETDLHARHRWLVQSHDAQNRLQAVRDNPEAYDAKIAGWWCWGACCWIGSGWCDTLDVTRGVLGNLSQQVPHLTWAPFGVHSPNMHGEIKPTKIWEGRGTGLQNPRHLHALGGDDHHRPQLADAFSRGRGVNGNDAMGTCEQRRRWITEWFRRLADRLRPVRVCCGHWSRICDSDSTLTRLGTTGVFLDPPYRHTVDGEENRAKRIYANDHVQDVDALCDEVQAWCLKWGQDKEIRIALCGLEGEYPLLTPELGWECIPWKSRGGYGNRTERGKENAARERIWFSRACLPDSPDQAGLFTE